MMQEPEILLTLKLKQQLFADTRRVNLLKQVALTGSLSQAAKVVGISYKTAWDAMNEMNNLAPVAMIIASAGGKGGGGAKLSTYAERFIQLYDLLTTLEYNAFNALNEHDVPLDNVLAATAKLSVQTSARNQLYGKIIGLEADAVSGRVSILLDDDQTRLDVNITQRSAHRLRLVKNKAVILLIKAPNVTILTENIDHLQNQLTAIINQITCEQMWSEVELKLASGLIICATILTKQLETMSLTVQQTVTIYINPENIILATLI